MKRPCFEARECNNDTFEILPSPTKRTFFRVVWNASLGHWIEKRKKKKQNKPAEKNRHANAIKVSWAMSNKRTKNMYTFYIYAYRISLFICSKFEKIVLLVLANRKLYLVFCGEWRVQSMLGLFPAFLHSKLNVKNSSEWNFFVCCCFFSLLLFIWFQAGCAVARMILVSLLELWIISHSFNANAFFVDIFICLLLLLSLLSGFADDCVRRFFILFRHLCVNGPLSSRCRCSFMCRAEWKKTTTNSLFFWVCDLIAGGNDMCTMFAFVYRFHKMKLFREWEWGEIVENGIVALLIEMYASHH